MLEVQAVVTPVHHKRPAVVDLEEAAVVVEVLLLALAQAAGMEGLMAVQDQMGLAVEALGILLQQQLTESAVEEQFALSGALVDHSHQPIQETFKE